MITKSLNAEQSAAAVPAGKNHVSIMAGGHNVGGSIGTMMSGTAVKCRIGTLVEGVAYESDIHAMKGGKAIDCKIGTKTGGTIQGKTSIALLCG